MKTIFATVIVVMSLSMTAFAENLSEEIDLSSAKKVKANGQAYESFTIYGVIPAGSQAYVLVNYRMVKEQCGGLSQRECQKSSRRNCDGAEGKSVAQSCLY